MPYAKPAIMLCGLFIWASCSHFPKSRTIQKNLLSNMYFECVVSYAVDDSIISNMSCAKCTKWADCKSTYYSLDSMIIISISIDKADGSHSSCDLAKIASYNNKKEYNNDRETNIVCLDDNNAYMYLIGIGAYGPATIFDGFAMRDSLMVNVEGLSSNIDSSEFAHYCAMLLRRIEIVRPQLP